MKSNAHYEDISLAKELTDEALLDIFSGSSNLKKYNGKGNKLADKLTVDGQKYLPQEVLFEETTDSYDNPENRFIKYFINWCLGIIERFNEVFVSQEDFRNTELIEANFIHIKKTDFLKECRRNAVNSNVFYDIDSSGWVSPNI